MGTSSYTRIYRQLARTTEFQDFTSSFPKLIKSVVVSGYVFRRIYNHNLPVYTAWRISTPFDSLIHFIFHPSLEKGYKDQFEEYLEKIIVNKANSIIDQHWESIPTYFCNKDRVKVFLSRELQKFLLPDSKKINKTVKSLLRKIRQIKSSLEYREEFEDEIFRHRTDSIVEFLFEEYGDVITSDLMEAVLKQVKTKEVVEE
jgi:hypothetical protein